MGDVGAMMGFDKDHCLNAANLALGSREESMAKLGQDAERIAKLLSESGQSEGAGAGDIEMSSDAPDAAAVSAWNAAELMEWLKAQGGLSADCLQTIDAAKVDGELWLQASEEDWRSEEFDIQDTD